MPSPPPAPAEHPSPASAPAVQLPAPPPNATPNPLQTTNVYINGLPPHYKDEELYALAAQFGTVLSCRTFTRQLSDTPSGYGFVLFETMDAAQACINVLRSHHNLHPHFAKQAHKIPGVPAAPAAQPDPAPAACDIYLEGLPMHVDTPTLHALLAPHSVLSSRFFADTRAQPPLLVAFVRLASRAAAEDVYGRLHGRAVRGYSARLAVSLADATTAVESAHISGLPIAQPEPFDPDACMQFSLSPPQAPADALLRARGMQSTHTLGALPRAHPPALQPLSATLHELQAQLASLRPLLAAYDPPAPYEPGGGLAPRDAVPRAGLGGPAPRAGSGDPAPAYGVSPFVRGRRHVSDPGKAPGAERERERAGAGAGAAAAQWTRRP